MHAPIRTVIFDFEGTLVDFQWRLAEAEAELRSKLTPEALAAIVNLIPDAWLGDEPRFATPDAHRAAYVEYLLRRLEASPIFVEEALRARSPRL